MQVEFSMEDEVAAHARWHKRCCKLILACCVLHNFCIDKGDLPLRQWKLSHHDDDRVVGGPPPPQMADQLELQTARLHRQAIGDQVNNYHEEHLES